MNFYPSQIVESISFYTFYGFGMALAKPAFAYVYRNPEEWPQRSYRRLVGAQRLEQSLAIQIPLWVTQKFASDHFPLILKVFNTIILKLFLKMPASIE